MSVGFLFPFSDVSWISWLSFDFSLSEMAPLGAHDVHMQDSCQRKLRVWSPLSSLISSVPLQRRSTSSWGGIEKSNEKSDLHGVQLT
jgi:hypothetical protein